MKQIVICAGAPDPNLAILKKLKDPFLIGVDGGAKRLIDAGYSLNLAIGDFDSVSIQQADEVIVLPTRKDDTDLEFTLKTIIQRYNLQEIEQIIILGALGAGRLDHLICNVWLVFNPAYHCLLNKLLFIEKRNTVQFYQAGQYTLTKEKDKKYLSFITLTPVKQLTLEQVEYCLWKQDYDRPMALISNEFIGETMCFSLTDGLLCVIQSVD